MRRPPRSRSQWIFLLAIVVPAGILSRTVSTGFVLFDKYLGDALYAAMVYALFRLLWPFPQAAAGAAAMIIAIESFQLTLIAARMLTSEHLIVRITARLLGTHFSFPDLLAYFAAIGSLFAWEWLAARNRGGVPVPGE